MMSSKIQKVPNSFEYIQQMLTELRVMSENENAPVLAYVIEMAIIEAKEMGESIQLAQPSPADDIVEIKQLVT